MYLYYFIYILYVIIFVLKLLIYPNDEKALAYLTLYHAILRQRQQMIPMRIDVMRDGIELRLNVEAFTTPRAYARPFSNLNSHELLENNIGLINPGAITSGEIHDIMRNFADTDGLIVDLRQYPNVPFLYELSGYLLDEVYPHAIFTTPVDSMPGVFGFTRTGISGPGAMWPYLPEESTFFYEKEVVLLMDTITASQPETTIMSLRNGPNVTVLGKNSMGANGNVVSLPLPGGFGLAFSGIGVYYPDGSQTQRIGLSPDIYVERTIVGVKEGIDEILETAIRFLLERRSYYR